MSSSFPNSAGFGFNPVSSIAAATSSITTDNALGQGSGVGRDFSTQTHYEPAVHDSRPPTIHELCQAGDIPALERLWAEGNCDVNERDGTDVTPLHWAAINAQIGTCQWLLDHGAEVDAVGGELRATPLQWAARNGHLYVLHLLLKNSADPNIRDCQGFNTLHLVTHSSVVMALLYILQQPIAVDERDSDGHTALMWASWQGDAISVDLLLRHGASVAAMDNAQLTPLHWASVKGSRACVKRLLDAGADVWAQEENGKTAKDMAKELKALEPYRLALEDHGWDVNGRPKERLLSPVSMRRHFFVSFLFCALLNEQGRPLPLPKADCVPLRHSTDTETHTIRYTRRPNHISLPHLFHLLFLSHIYIHSPLSRPFLRYAPLSHSILAWLKRIRRHSHRVTLLRGNYHW